jgi:hypothetical protein
MFTLDPTSDRGNIGRILPFRAHNGQGITRLGIANGLRLTLQFYDRASALERDREIAQRLGEQIQPAKTRSTSQHVTVRPSCYFAAAQQLRRLKRRADVDLRVGSPALWITVEATNQFKPRSNPHCLDLPGRNFWHARIESERALDPFRRSQQTEVLPIGTDDLNAQRQAVFAETRRQR